MKDKKKYLIIVFQVFLCTMLCCSSELIAQKTKQHFENVPDLSQNIVNSIMQDSYGFLWIGTDGGLNMYDGYTFTVYTHNPADSNSLFSNKVLALLESKDGTIWIGTSNGLNRFDPRTKTFIRYSFPPEIPPYQEGRHSYQVDQAHIQTLVEDKDGILWVGTRNGLCKFDSITETVTWFDSDPSNQRSLSSRWVETLLIDASGIVWVATYDGLNKYNPITNDFTRHLYLDTNRPKKYAEENRIYSLLEDSYGTLWIGAEKGLHRFNTSRDELKPIQFESVELGELYNEVRSIVEDPQGNIWLVINDKLVKFDQRMMEYEITIDSGILEVLLS